jgi:hypothetical protein
MSLHAQLSQEVTARLATQRRLTTLSSIAISFLLVIAIGLLLGLIFLPSLISQSPTIVTYHPVEQKQETLQSRKISNQISRKPPAPSSAMAQVIATAAYAQVSIPVPNEVINEPSLVFGDGDDFGAGWGNGSGTESTGGGPTFFQQQVKAERVAYVIDYSGSMGGKREQLMREELAKSVKSLPAGSRYQMIFFAGPAWIAGDSVSMAPDQRSAVVSDGNSNFRWSLTGGGDGWQPDGRSRRASWITADESRIQSSLSNIRNTPLASGTQWDTALDMALAMKPAPQVIFFMTDGETGGNLKEIVRRTTNRAKTRDITINTIAMMEPKAHDAMRDMAQKTGGMFTIIEADGSIRKVPLENN